MPIDRRTLLVAAVGGSVLGLSGCGRLAVLTDTKGRALSEAAESVEGVESAAIRFRREAEFRPYAVGDILLTATDRAGVLAGYQRALRAVITAIHDDIRPDGALVVERVEGVGSSIAGRPGLRVGPKDLGIRGRWESDFNGNPRRGLIYASTCYEHFGLS